MAGPGASWRCSPRTRPWKTASPACGKPPINTNGRRLAHKVLVGYERTRGSLREWLEKEGASFPPPDRALGRDLALGVVQRLNTLDWALAPLASRPFDELDPPVRAAVRIGGWQLLFAAGRFPPHAAVHESVSLVSFRAQSIVNAMLRTLQRQGGLRPFPGGAVERLSLAHSYPDWIVRRWTARFGKEAEGLLAAGNAPPPFSLRANRLKTTPQELVDRLAREKKPAALSTISPDGVRADKFFFLGESPAFKEGLFSVQDEAAQLAVHVLDPQPGEAVLDLCAGVGGKSVHMAERMGNKGRVTAVDRDADRLGLLKENALRAGVDIVAPAAGDARSVTGSFDRVLVDAPCSGLGTLRRRPDIKWARTEKDAAERLPALQKDILLAAADRVKPGGVLVYATCTTEPEENEGVARALLSGRRDFSADPPEGADADGFRRLRPDLHGADGFFIAKFKRSL